jgi:GT2 family glycosyltransferase
LCCVYLMVYVKASGNLYNGMNSGKVCVIIVNWNGWQDTISCLKSILLSKTQPERIIVCDNGSSDRSPELILSWVAEHKEFVLDKHKEGDLSLENRNSILFTLLRNDSNLGYAAGNNKGIQFALSENKFQFIWLLNNDASVQFNSLGELLRCSRESSAGIFGSTIVYDDRKEFVQCAGGCSYNPLTTCFRPILAGKPLKDVIHASSPLEMDYIYGASFFVRSNVFKQCGLLNESFFLFYEEIDFCRRAMSVGYKLFWCKKSVVVHKGSKSIGRPGISDRNKIAYANYHENFSTLLFTKIHHKKLLPCVLLIRFFGKLMMIVLRGEWFLVSPLVKAYRDFLY